LVLLGENMSGNDVQDKKEALSDEERAKLFVKDYEALCEKHQMRIVTTPAFKARDDGTFSVVLQVSVGKLPQQ
jgi:hypothetical protein